MRFPLDRLGMTRDEVCKHEAIGHNGLMAQSKDKIEAIYDLRQAAEEKARAEAELHYAPSEETRDALLDAQMTLEEKTLYAIEVCHECGHEHAPSQPHRRPPRRTGTLHPLNFERNRQTKPGADAPEPTEET
jgi:hypothetical protein